VGKEWPVIQEDKNLNTPLLKNSRESYREDSANVAVGEVQFEGGSEKAADWQIASSERKDIIYKDLEQSNQVRSFKFSKTQSGKNPQNKVGGSDDRHGGVLGGAGKQKG